MAMFSKRINLILIKQIELNHSLEEKSKNFETQIQTQSQGAIKAVGNLATYHMVASQLMQGGDEKENLRAILETIIANYRFYFCGIFLLDEKNQNLNFLVGSGEVGSILAASNHQVKVSEHVVFSETVSSHNVQAIPDVTTSPSYSPIPIMGATRSQFTFPILSRGHILGLIDLHDDKPRVLSPDEQKTLEWIASLIGRNSEYGTLETAYQDSQKELKAIYREMTRKNWQTYFRVRKRKYSIRLSHSGLEKDVSAPPEVGEIINNGQPLFMAAQKTKSSKPCTSIAIPIKLKNEVLGALNVHVDSNKPMQSLVPVLEAAADRLAIALENARLLEEIREKANREHLVSEISAKVRSATNVEQVLKTTAMEISHSLGVSEVVI